MVNLIKLYSVYTYIITNIITSLISITLFAIISDPRDRVKTGRGRLRRFETQHNISDLRKVGDYEQRNIQPSISLLIFGSNRRTKNDSRDIFRGVPDHIKNRSMGKGRLLI